MAKDPAFASPGPTARWERANRARLSWTRTPGWTRTGSFNLKFKLARARCAGGSTAESGCPGLGPGARRRWQAARGCPAAT